MKFNPHIHVLISEGGLDAYKIWHDIPYIDYTSLRKKWQYLLLKRLREKYGKSEKIKRAIDKLYKNSPKGFYVNAERRITNRRSIVKYLGRYLNRPAIAESRIKEYDGKEVLFWYEDHNTKKKIDVRLPVLEFIGKLVSHIPPKNFHMVRRYGLYQGSKNKKFFKVVEFWQSNKGTIEMFNIPYKKRKISWRKRMEWV